MSYEDLYNQINKITGYTFNNYAIYWPNEIKQKNETKKSRILRSNINNNNDNNKKNTSIIYENEDIVINEYNIDKCQNFISFKTNELIMMENYNIIQNDIEENYYYEYNLEIKLINNNKSINSNNYNNQDTIPRIFKVYLLEKGDEHLIYNYIYQYLELYNEKDKDKNKKKINKSQNNIKTSKNLSAPSLSKSKNKINKQNCKKDVNKLFLEDVKKYISKQENTHYNNNCIILEEEKDMTYEKKYILGVVCKSLPNNSNNSHSEIICPLCNKKSKKISEEIYECFCINQILDNEFKIKNKENKKLLSSQLINYIEQNSYSHKPLITIRVHPYSNFSFLNFNKFTIYTVTTNISRSKKKFIRQQNLMDLFESFAAEEKIENSCTCDKCGDINKTYQKKDIHKFPQILIIHIKRFKNEVEKNEEKIEFPQEIDLSKYNNKGNLGKYSLNSAVFHQGTLISGHYTSIFKYLPTNKWLFCNDIKVKFLNGDKIMGINPAYNKDDIASIGDGYILFYRKND